VFVRRCWFGVKEKGRKSKKRGKRGLVCWAEEPDLGTAERGRPLQKGIGAGKRAKNRRGQQRTLGGG